MLNKIKLVLNNGQLMKGILITLLLLFVYKVTTYIPIPMLNVDAINSTIKQTGFIQFVDSFAGGGLSRYSVAALGITPYITASIVIQLLQMDIVPKFKQWSEEGEIGKQKLNQATRYLSVCLAFFQSIVLLLGLNVSVGNLVDTEVVGNVNNVVAIIYMSVIITAGTAFVLWIADLITRYGVGNGSSMIIVAGILTTLPNAFISLWGKKVTHAGGTYDYVYFAFIVLLYILILIGVIYMELAKRKIPTQYANRQGKTDSNIPIKLNTAGVIPVIFASTLMSIPATIMSLMGSNTESGSGFWFDQIFNYENPIGFIIYIFLIFIFSFFYTFLTVNPEHIADDLQKQNAYIPGVRPGEETQLFISRVLFKVTMLGATYLAVLSAIPIITTAIFHLDSTMTIGGTGLLIVIGVAVETVKQIETNAVEQTYKGFM